MREGMAPAAAAGEGRPRRVVIAPDSFKGTIDAGPAAEALRDGWLNERTGDEVIVCPQADGGEGTLTAIGRCVPGAIVHVVEGVTGPDGTPRRGEWLELPGGVGVVEMAQMSGLPLMGELDPMGATSRGLGEVMAAALDSGIRRLIVGIGGSASTDAGLPVRDALGSRRPPVDGAVVLTDVTAPLLGPHGAAAVFAPQKGADAAQVALLEERLADAAALLGGDPGEPGTGAAGGVGFALHRWGAVLTGGAAHVAALTGLTDLVVEADLVITGEGRYDSQSLGGKVVGHVIELGRASGTPVAVVAGAAGAEPAGWYATLTDLAGSGEAAMADPARWLGVAGRGAARALAAD